MRLHDLFTVNIEEDVTRRAGLIGAGSALFGKAALAKQPHAQYNKTTDNSCTAKTCNSHVENYLLLFAKKIGINGKELAAFMAQMAHETMGFNRMEETGSPRYFLRYDIKGNPAKARQLGNIHPGDGARFKGRGFIHLTGRENYKDVADALHINLLGNPELAAYLPIAAKIAVWFWKTKVKPYVSNWDDVRHVTKNINPGLKGLEDRRANYVFYKHQLPKLLASAVSKIEYP